MICKHFVILLSEEGQARRDNSLHFDRENEGSGGSVKDGSGKADNGETFQLRYDF